LPIAVLARDCFEEELRACTYQYSSAGSLVQDLCGLHRVAPVPSSSKGCWPKSYTVKRVGAVEDGSPADASNMKVGRARHAQVWAVVPVFEWSVARVENTLARASIRILVMVGPGCKVGHGRFVRGGKCRMLHAAPRPRPRSGITVLVKASN